MADVLIDCVDGTGRDDNGFYRRRILPTAIRVNTIGHMVDAIVARLGHSDRIRRLRIFGHGSPGRQGLGNSSVGGIWTHEISLAYFAVQRPYLERLCGHFAPGGWVELSGCEVGACTTGANLLRSLAILWDVHVAAGIGGEAGVGKAAINSIERRHARKRRRGA
jgi:hypothetical protein